VGEGDDAVIFDAGHGFGGDHGVDDGFLGGLDGGGEDGLDFVVGEHFQVDDVAGWIGRGGAWIGGGKGNEDVAGTVAGDAAVATEAEGDAAGQPLELMGEEGSVGGDNDNDRAAIELSTEA
jgi:hypothetical protein